MQNNEDVETDPLASIDWETMIGDDIDCSCVLIQDELDCIMGFDDGEDLKMVDAIAAILISTDWSAPHAAQNAARAILWYQDLAR